MKLYICEKPSQAADLAKVLGEARKRETHWETSGGRVTWCFGHLLEAAEPEDYDPKWKGWSLGTLPIVPAEFRYKATHGAGGRLREIGALLKEATSAVIATDAGREGEVIGREVLEHHRYRGQVERLWLGAMDPESVRNALGKMKPASASVNMFHAGRARMEADWLVGINGTRALTASTPRGNGVTSVGRVQTPTLALVVLRDREIASFKPRDYFELEAGIDASGVPVKLRYAPEEESRIYLRARAEEIAQQARGAAVVIRRKAEGKKQAPPKLYALSDLQGECSRRWGWGVKKTLGIAQSLYERHKATTYPRSDCNYLPAEQIPDVPVIWSNVTALPQFSSFAAVTPAPRSEVFNTAKVGEHNAIIPTRAKPDLAAMDADERRAYLLIAASYVASLLPDYEYLSTQLSAEAAGVVFVTRGVTPQIQGWRAAFDCLKAERDAASEDDSGDLEGGTELPNIADGTRGIVQSCGIDAKRTKAPPHYTEATLVKDMKAVAKFVADPAKRARLKETSGIGTEATRADVVETLKRVDYLLIKGKKLIATPKAHALYDRLAKEMPEMIDPAETASMEDELEEVAKGTKPAADYVARVVTRVRGYIATIARTAPPAAVAPLPSGTAVEANGVALSDCGEYWTAPNVKGRLYKTFCGHTFTLDEMTKLVKGDELMLNDLVSKTGAKLRPCRLKFNPRKKPFPGIEFVD